MALDRIDFPTTPNPVTGDWALINALMTKAFQNIQSPLQWSGTTVPQGTNIQSPLQWSGTTVPQGTVVQIGGVIYYGTSDTTITGTPSNYVKFTPNVGDSGATCDVAFIANLSGVSWSKLYNGYYSSGNLVVFDEVQAILDSDLGNGNTLFSRLFEDHLGQSLLPIADVEFSNIDIPTLTAGNNIVVAVDDETTRTNTVVIPRKEREMVVPSDGIVRMAFDMRAEATTSNDVLGRIYVNESPIGVIHENRTDTYETYTDDISVNAGDLIQLYIWSDISTVGAEHKNFRMKVGNVFTGLTKGLIASCGRYYAFHAHP